MMVFILIKSLLFLLSFYQNGFFKGEKSDLAQGTYMTGMEKIDPQSFTKIQIFTNKRFP